MCVCGGARQLRMRSLSLSLSLSLALPLPLSISLFLPPSLSLSGPPSACLVTCLSELLHEMYKAAPWLMDGNIHRN